MEQAEVSRKRIHRGKILEFVYQNHEAQRSRMDDLELWGLMLDMGIRVGQDYVVTRVQELRDRGYLTFESKFNNRFGTTQLSRIAITPQGKDVAERITTDPAVLIP